MAVLLLSHKSSNTELLPKPHHPHRRLLGEIRSHFGTTLAAGLASEARLDVRQPDVIWPHIAADRDRVAATIVLAVDQQPRTPISRISAKVIFWRATTPKSSR